MSDKEITETLNKYDDSPMKQVILALLERVRKLERYSKPRKPFTKTKEC